MYNQELKSDFGKPQLRLVPLLNFAEDVAEVREFGIKKYNDPDSWKNVELERYIDAMLRHLFKWLDDPESLDEESGLSHWKHFECNVAFISELRKNQEKHNKEVLEMEKNKENVVDKKCENCKWYESQKINSGGLRFEFDKLCTKDNLIINLSKGCEYFEPMEEQENV